MRTYFLAIAFFAVLLAPASAQQFRPIRAIEHPEYSRLVVPIPVDAEWKISQSESSVTFVVETDFNYDVTAVFDRMPRTRVLSVEAASEGDRATVSISLACACEAEATPVGSNFVALDIRRREGGDGTARFLTDPTTEFAEPSMTEAEAEGPEIVEKPQPESPDADPEESGTRETAGVENPIDEIVEDRALVAARAALEGRLSAAIGAGLLEPVEPPVASVEAEETSLIGSGDGSLEDHLNVRDGRQYNRRRAEPEDGLKCPDPKSLDAAVWAEPEGGFLASIARHRRELVSLTGDVDAAAVESLARVYIGAGFGREAAALIKGTSLAGEEAELLADLSMVIEGKAPPEDGVLAKLEGCSGKAHLWRVAAGLASFEQSLDGGRTAREALEDLPHRLRRLLGQSIARHALSAGDTGTARDVLDLLDSTPGGSGDDDIEIRAAMMLSDGQAEDALVATREAAYRANPDPALLLIHARAAVALGKRPEPPLITALDTALDTRREEGLGLKFRFLRTELEALSGRPVTAIRALAAMKERGVDTTQVGQIAHRILRNVAVSKVRTPESIEAMLAGAPLLNGSAEARETRIFIVEALVEDGLPNAALKVLGAELLDNRIERMLRARALLAVGAPEAAVAAFQNFPADEKTAPIETRARLSMLDTTEVGARDAIEVLAELEGNRLAEVEPLLNLAPIPEGPDTRTSETAREALVRSKQLRAALDPLIQ